MKSKTQTIDNFQDIIDSREVIDRIAELESDRDDLRSAIDEAIEALTDASASPEQYPEWAYKKEDLEEAVTVTKHALAEWLENEYGEELKALEALAEEAAGYAKAWAHGEALIRDSYFETYAQDLAEDIGAINKDASWPNDCIDWEKAADQLKQDYTEVDFDGVAYWIRS